MGMALFVLGVRLSLQTNEGRALAVLLTMLGVFGRGEIRKVLLNNSVLDVMNEFERAFDQLACARNKGGRGG